MSKRINGFDGLRGLAVLLVFAQHKTPVEGVGFGQLGVWIFFVLSGFLITGILTMQRRSIELGGARFATEIKRFLFRRTLRIFPVYYLLLLTLTGLTALGLLGQSYADGMPYHAVYLSNLWIAYIKEAWPERFSHLWSLSVEEQFYLILAPVLLLVPSRRHWIVCIAIAIVGAATLYWARATEAPQLVVYTHPLINFWLLALGGAAFHLLSRNEAWTSNHLSHPGIFVAAAIGLSYFCSHEPLWRGAMSAQIYTLSWISYGLTVGLLVMWVASNQKSRIVGFLDATWLASLGRISYGFYLFHPFIPDLAKSARVQAIWAGNVPMWISVMGVALCFAVSVAVSVLSWRFIEKPLLRLKDTPRSGEFVAAATQKVGL